MGFLILIIVIGVLIYFYKSNTSSTNTRTTATVTRFESSRDNSSYNQDISRQDIKKKIMIDYIKGNELYEQYKAYFDAVIQMDDNIQTYKVDYLYESLQNEDLDDNPNLTNYYIIESINRQYPYYCATENELDVLSGRYAFMKISPLKEYTPSIIEAMIYYYKQPLKLEFWKNKLVDLARQEDMLAVAVLASNSPLINGKFSESEMTAFHNLYYEKFMKKVEEKDPYAVLGYVNYIERDRRKCIQMLNEAAKDHELSDVYFKLHELYSSVRLHDDDIQRRDPSKNNTLSDIEISELAEKENQCLYAAAKANNGFMAGIAQEQLAWRYEDGDMGFPLDIEKAIYWFEKACENGVDCKYKIDYLKNQS